MPKEEIAVIIDKGYPEVDAYIPEVHQQVQQKVEETADPITLGQIMTVIWLTGVVAMVVWLATTNLLIGRSLRSSKETLACESPIPVYVSKKAGSPCLVGLFRPAVYLTPECAADENILRYSLTHELAHYVHKDHIWALVRCVCLCVYWFDPLVWVAAWFSRQDCELACDEGAIKRLGEEERIAYGRALLQVVTNTFVPGRLMLIATTMAETKKQLRQRVNFIARKPKWSIVAAVCMVLICAVVAGCTATGPVRSVEEPIVPSTGPDVPEADGPHRFAMHDLYHTKAGWIELDENGNAMFYRCLTNYTLELKLQELGMKPGRSVYNSVYRYSGTCVLEGDTYTLVVEKVEETYELECSDPEALLAAVLEDCGEEERADYERKFRGEYVDHEQDRLPKLTFRMTDGKLTDLEVEWRDDVREVYRFYPNGNTQTIEGSEPGSICTRTEYYENGNIRSYRSWRNNDSQEYYLEAYNEHGDIVSSGNYLIDYRTGGNEYEYEYYEDGTKKHAWQYSVGEGASNRHLEYHTEYHPNGTVKSQSTYNYKDNLRDYQEFDIYGKWTYYAEYNSEGEMYHHARAEYRYSDAGVMLELKRYENDVLMCHYEYYGNGQKKIRRDYHSNGQLSIYEEYDERGNVIFTQRYDPDGTPWE